MLEDIIFGAIDSMCTIVLRSLRTGQSYEVESVLQCVLQRVWQRVLPRVLRSVLHCVLRCVESYMVVFV